MKPFRTTLALCMLVALAPVHARGGLNVGTAVVDVTPEQLPVLVNGGMVSRSVEKVNTRLHGRALVLDDGNRRAAIVVVDSCMMPRPLLDEAKAMAAERTKIRPDHMLISASHTHGAPSSMGCLGTDADAAYVPFLKEKLAGLIAAAEATLEPAQVGWAVTDAADLTALRRWIRRPDRIADDPFGNPTVRANMHAGRNWDDVTGESGPEDPDLSIIAFQSTEGRPLALLANFSMHYFGDPALSADYFGLFSQGVEAKLAEKNNTDGAPFVAIMSHGCSGDIWRRDYTKPPGEQGEDYTIESYTQALVDRTTEAYKTISYKSNVDLAMAEARLPMDYRVPDQQLLQWAERIVEAMGDRPPKDTTEVYAREQVILHERRSTEIVVQALRIGDIAIATTPNETYALTGLKLKLQSPLERTMVIELANGGDGYIPPPEQFRLGGYNTWPARSAGLEVEAEPRITEAALELLEQVAGRPRRVYKQTCGPACQALLEAEPLAYWRMDEFAPPLAVDASGRRGDAFYESGVVFFLEGPRSDRFCVGDETNRAAHFAGGRLRAHLPEISDRYTVSMWFWNGMPVDARPIAGWMFSRGRDHGLGPWGDHLGVAGTAAEPGKLVFLHGDPAEGAKLMAGRTEIPRWTWNHVVLVRDGRMVKVYLNGRAEPEIEARTDADVPPGLDQMFFGGRSDNQANWEGRLDEIAVFGRALSAEEIQRLK